MKKAALAALCAAVMVTVTGAGIGAQDFGFGFDDEEAAAPAAVPVSVKVGGEVSAQLLGFVHDFSSAEKVKGTSLGDVVSGALNFSAAGSNADAFIGLNLSAAALGELADYDWGSPNRTPLILDEAYLRAYFGPVNIEAGLRKLTWGKADSLGPLDIVNPLDYSDLTNSTDVQAIKIARPMVHLSWNTGDFSKIEGVFVPNFTGHRFADTGRWTPAQYSTMADTAKAGIFEEASAFGDISGIPGAVDYFNSVNEYFSQNFDVDSVAAPYSGGLEYFQAGLRFTTTVGSADIGGQYFYGNLFRPDFAINGVDSFITELMNHFGKENPPFDEILARLDPQLRYNRYHQIGIDYAQVLFGLNVRAEFAAHLTEDLKGTDGSVRNPFLAWSLGFDRDLFGGINANIQCNETIRLLNNKVGTNPVMDCEADTDMTATRITAQISKKFLRDNLETKATTIWDIENFGCYIIPAVVWTIGDVTSELSAGVFAGKDGGELGQYWENSYVKVGMKYSF